MQSNIDIAKSYRVAELVDAKAAMCFLNSYKALSLPECDRALYVQGFAGGRGKQPIEHCWLEQDGRIIEPTIRTLGPKLKYFAAEKFDEQARALAAKLPLYEMNPPYPSLIDEPKDYNSGLFGRLSHESCKAGETYRKQWIACSNYCEGTDGLHWEDSETIREAEIEKMIERLAA